MHPTAKSNHWIDPIDLAESVATSQQRTVKAQISAHVIVASARIERERCSFTVDQTITEKAFGEG